MVALSARSSAPPLITAPTCVERDLEVPYAEPSALPREWPSSSKSSTAGTRPAPDSVDGLTARPVFESSPILWEQGVPQFEPGRPDHPAVLSRTRSSDNGYGERNSGFTKPLNQIRTDFSRNDGERRRHERSSRVPGVPRPDALTRPRGRRWVRSTPGREWREGRRGSRGPAGASPHGARTRVRSRWSLHSLSRG